MPSKVPIELPDYLVRLPIDKQKDGNRHKLTKCIINVSSDLADYLGVSAYVFQEQPGLEIDDPVNVTHYGAYQTGTYHGKEVTIITDGKGGNLYKKTYSFQAPEAYPILFIRQFLQGRQSATSNTIAYVKVRGGRRFPVSRVALPPSPNP